VLIDSFNRPITNLRVSVTQRCNLKCIYCHAEGEQAPSKEMSADQISEILKISQTLGIKKVKFTGGEPLIRDDIVDIINSVPKGMESSLTTNGTFIANYAHDLKSAGLSRVNISIDTLNRERYKKITGKDCLNSVLTGIESSLDAGLTPVKLNMVILRHINEDEIDRFIHFIRSNRNLILQIIEFMEFNNCSLHADLGCIEEDLQKRSEKIIIRRMHHRRKYYVDNAEVEVVKPLHNTEFCAFCNRLRVTSDGKLKPCLLRTDNLIDINDKKGEELEALFYQAMKRREPFFK